MFSRRAFVTRYLLAPLAANFAVLGWFASRDPGWWGLKGVLQRLECLAGRQPVLVQGLHQELPQAGPLPQRLLAAEPGQPRLETADAQDWKFYTVPAGRPGQTLLFEVRPQSREMSFYPRVSGEDSSVELLLEQGGTPRRAALLQGKQGVWTPIGARWSASVACHDPGAPVVAHVRLTGPWAQLWARETSAFF
ncbi:hypothetical protein NNJEOMEG_03021 [Fundidesulfovibrio magnetotacticus]|uniref:Uncharacterized protein n=1 Tax=Fundidesulfovibrio magnetotacticus TaxID=2730080 RepID=A0A6V8LRR6_9BACT|nr:hypothetical protein [Fundidesulfovibrio magnetotacticus]GFK95163.1 hypothetical protein NNJEOMEG_03021 [Fundidesulfovibrio magnetotacticus]